MTGQVMKVSCPDGFLVKSTDREELIHDVQYHVKKEHNKAISRKEAEKMIEIA